MSKRKPVLLCILDGWGLNPSHENNAIAMAQTPNFDRLWQQFPHTTLRADGLTVGLPEGQFGNSEVGHMNIGAGRVVMQDLPRITKAVENGSLTQNPQLLEFISRMKQSNGAVHLMGLMSPGGVHAHQDHIAAMVRILHDHGVKVVLHLFTDGRDTPPDSAPAYLEKLLGDIPSDTVVGTVSGRFYAMDRDNRWERVSRAWEAIVNGKGLHEPTTQQAIAASYARQEQDEFIQPTVIGDYTGMKPQDGIFMANFRSDRAREILRALLLPIFDGFDRGEYQASRPALGMVEYADDLNPFLTTLFPSLNMTGLLGELVSQAGMTQLRTAETEKYPHVTFFFNGGQEAPYPGEQRLLVASPKVATYDLQPEMSAIELTDKLIAAINTNQFDFIVLNYANPDMVGHSGNIPATIRAVETVDACLGRLFDTVSAQGGVMVITADHGNADQMVDPDTGGAYTAHTTNPVPFIITGAPEIKTLKSGKLGDIAPTVLQLLGIKQPDVMTGSSLIA